MKGSRQGATAIQLGLLAELAAVFGAARVRVWLRGGWALDFLRGEVTRPNSDVDLEDFVFLDARMPLAGFELSLGITRRRPLPAPFWEGYRRREGEGATLAPEGWEEAWPVFRLFYLLQWSWIPFDPRQHAGPAEQRADVERFERAIVEVASLEGPSMGFSAGFSAGRSADRRG